MPMRHFTVTGMLTASRIAIMHSATISGSAIRHAPKRPLCTRSLGTADVEVDLVVAVLLAELRGPREQLRVGAAELQRDRVLRSDRSPAGARGGRARAPAPSPSPCTAASAGSAAAAGSGSAGPCSPSSARRRGAGRAAVPARHRAVSATSQSTTASNASCSSAPDCSARLVDPQLPMRAGAALEDLAQPFDLRQAAQLDRHPRAAVR